jgi:aspartate 1-decarboxylase
MLKSKIHRAVVTDANLAYEGSLTVDRELMEAADLLPFEQVMVYNISTGERFETYVIEGERGSGHICLNGAAARKGARGDLVIVASYGGFTPEEIRHGASRLVWVDQDNRIVKKEVVSWS